MENQIIRFFVLFVLLFLLTSDIKDLLDALSTTKTLGPYLTQWKPSQSLHSRKAHKSHRPVKRVTLSQNGEVRTSYSEDSDESDPANLHNPFKTFRSEEDEKEKVAYSKQNRISPEELYSSLTDDEKQELLKLKSQMTKIMQEWCLPKLVCELHASLGDRSSGLSEAERGLLSIIKETSMNPMGEVVSKYHFAAHMGQLLSNVEGNGCHNFYPNCPLSGTKVLQMVKKVRIK